VAIVFTGGTISMTADPVAGGNIPTLDPAALLARVPGLEAIAELEIVDRGRTPASHLRPSDLLELARAVEAVLADPTVTGAVVVQGTDTIEESAFLIDLVSDAAKPIVVTGAMRAASDEGYDGPVNLRDAVACAAAPVMRGSGTSVVLGGSIHAADDVVKSHTSAITAFSSPNLGPIGWVDAGRVHLARGRGLRRHVRTDRVSDRVDLVTVVSGMDGRLIDGALASGTDGLVIAATGAGNTSPAVLAAAERALAVGVPVALTTRVPAGRASAAYAFPGGGATWLQAGAMLVGTLSGPKARIAMALGVGAGLGPAELAALLADPEARGDQTAPADVDGQP
jgi:L-asparaginase